jgi:hypothetical protein
MKALAASIETIQASFSSFDETILQRRERPLGAPARLGRIGPDMLDPQMLQRPADLRQMAPVDLAGLGRVEIMRPAIRIEAHRQAMFGENLLQRPEGRGHAFLLDEKRRIDRPRRVVQGHDQVERRRALEPLMARAVLMQHHARLRPPLALAAMGPLARRFPDDALPLQMQLQPSVTMSRSRGPSPDAHGNV